MNGKKQRKALGALGALLIALTPGCTGGLTTTIHWESGVLTRTPVSTQPQDKPQPADERNP